jgi:hypothetical protein
MSTKDQKHVIVPLIRGFNRSKTAIITQLRQRSSEADGDINSNTFPEIESNMAAACMRRAEKEINAATLCGVCAPEKRAIQRNRRDSRKQGFYADMTPIMQALIGLLQLK